MKNTIFPIMVLLFTASCQAQSGSDEQGGIRQAGGPCEGCEAVREYGDKVLKAVDTLPGFGTILPMLKVTGTIFHSDGRTPAEGVILYIYHTNREGRYPRSGNETGWGRRHGLHRGWIKTGPDGRYTFFTFRPGSYPSGSEPEHIHATVLEPGVQAYYIDDYLFDDDPLLTKAKRTNRPNRGGSGIVVLQPAGEMLIAERDIVLGENIPGY